MSTWLYLECLDHTPPLRADLESGQHLSDLPSVRVDIANREQLIEQYTAGEGVQGAWPYTGMRGVYQRHTAAFLTDHPHCRIGIRDEYGRRHTAEPRPT